MKFYIAVEEMRSTVVEVEADNSEQAISKAERAYADDVICLNDTDYIDDGTCFYDETDRWTTVAKNGMTNFQVI